MISFAVTETKFSYAIAKLNKGEGASYSKLLRIVEANGIARRARPSMVFDSEGSVLADKGALSLLQSVPEVVPPPEGKTGYDMKIIVHLKGMLLGEPIIEALDDGNVSVTVRRIRGTSWEVLVASRAQLLAANGIQPARHLSPARYRLEIVPR